MKSTIFSIIVLAALLFAASSIEAQSKNNGQGKQIKTNWVDSNADGICDNLGTSNQGSGKGYGKKDGTGIPYAPKDGTGYGSKSKNADGLQSGSARQFGRK